VSSMTPAEELRAHLRDDLKAAMRAGQRETVALLRTLIAAVDNAEAVPVDESAARSHRQGFATGGAEAARKILSRKALANLLADEAQSRRAAALSYRAGGESVRAEALEREAAMVEGYSER
jgi:uncharacterized protein